MSSCSACGAPMLWTVDLITGRPRPLDPEPHADDSGNIAARYTEGRWESYSISTVRPLRDGFQTYTAHHATCKNWKKLQAVPVTDPDLFEATAEWAAQDPDG